MALVRGIMSFRALLVTKDDQARDVLTPVLSNFGLSVHACSYPDALCVVTEQKFHAVLVDFDDPHSAALVIENLSNTRFQSHAISVALLSDKTKVRHAFGHGANFVLFKPVTQSVAESTLRAAASLIRNERRNSFRVPVQVPVKLAWNTDEDAIDGILLDLSEEGMDVLASQPLYCSAMVSARFRLPDLGTQLDLPGEVVWANPNGESGIRFADIAENECRTLRTWILEHSKPIAPPEPAPRPDCHLTDLSLGGCYMETPSPYPEKTPVLVEFRAGKAQLQTPGVVRVMHPAHGMGIEFTNSPEQRREIEDFIQSLAQSEGAPELLVSPCSHPHEPKSVSFFPHCEDPLLDLLRNHQSLTQETFLQMLQKQRKSPAAPA